MANIEDLIQRARTIRIETKSKKNTAARIGGLLLDIVSALDEAQVLKKAQYGGIVATSSDLVSDYTDKGYSGPYFYLVGSSLSSLVVYQYAGTGSPAQVFGGAAYNFADYSEALSRIDDLDPELDEIKGLIISENVEIATSQQQYTLVTGQPQASGYVNVNTTVKCKRFDVEGLSHIWLTAAAHGGGNWSQYAKYIFFAEDADITTEGNDLGHLAYHTGDEAFEGIVEVPAGAKWCYTIGAGSFTIKAATISEINRLEQVESRVENVENESKISILFIGNSLQADVVAYLPLLLKEAKITNFTIYIWYIGGANMAEHLDTFVNETNCDIFGTWSGDNNAWVSRSTNIQDVLANCTFDVVCLQDYFNGYNTIDEWDITPFKDVVSYIRSNYAKNPLTFVSLLPAAKRNTIATHTKIHNIILEAYQRIITETDVKLIIPAGIAIKNALDNDTISSLGDNGFLSYDGIHAQEGLPCMLQTYVLAECVYKIYGLQYGIAGSAIRITTDAQITEMNVPNSHGTPVGMSDANCAIAQKIALETIKESELINSSSITENNAVFGSGRLATSNSVYNSSHIYKALDLSSISGSKILIYGNTWAQTDSSLRRKVVEVKPQKKYVLSAVYGTSYTVLHSVGGIEDSVDYATGYDALVAITAGEKVVIEVPLDGNYIYFNSFAHVDIWRDTEVEIKEILSLDDVNESLSAAKEDLKKLELPKVVSNNLFDYKKAVASTVLKENGTTSANATYWITGNISVNPSVCDYIYINRPAYRVCVFDSENNLVAFYGGTAPRRKMSIIGGSYIIACFNTNTDFDKRIYDTIVTYANSSDEVTTHDRIDTQKMSVADKQYFNIDSILDYATDKKVCQFDAGFTFGPVLKGSNGNKNMVVTADAMFTRSNGVTGSPTIRFAFSVNTNKVYESPEYIIGNSDYFETKQWRLPPFPKYCLLYIYVTIPEDVSLYIRSFENSYTDVINRNVTAYKLNAHFATHSIENLEKAARVGYPSCVVIPKRTSDGVWVCFHDEVIGTALKDANGNTPAQNHPNISNVGIWDLTYSELQTYTFSEDYLGIKSKVYKVEDFFRICARTGMNPMFSVHPTPTQAEYEELKALAIKWNVLGRLELKPLYDGLNVAVLEQVFGNNIKGVYVQVGNTAANTAIARLDTYNVDKNKVNVGVTINLVSRPSFTAEEAQLYINAGYHVVLYKPTFSGEEFAYWMANGVHEFTENSNYSYGLNW